MSEIEVLVDVGRRDAIARLEEAVSGWRARQGRPSISAEALSALPDGPDVAGDHEWRLRRHDLDLVRSLLRGRPPSRVLDFGAWNGWLSHRLASDGHEVTAADPFAGGAALGAPWPGVVGWRRVQAELGDLERLDERFGVVIANRCLGFTPDPVAAVETLRHLLEPGGMLIATGLMIHRSPAVPAARIVAEREAFHAWSGLELFLAPTRGFLDRSDLARLEAAGLRTAPYPALRLANLRSHIDRRRPEHRYGIT
ncbi:MAG: methyltransferase domain-containing protein [Chloroflexi bacterium]|nr:methyltransferase domain-containing protein [Chloroflexota bacterium]